MDLGKTSTVKMEGPAMESIVVTCRWFPETAIYLNMYSKLLILQDYLYTEYEVVSAGHGVNADCGAQPICGECGSGENNDCHGYSHQAYFSMLFISK